MGSIQEFFYNPGECVSVVKEYIDDKVNYNFSYDFNYDFSNLYNYRSLEQFIITNYTAYLLFVILIIYSIGIAMGYLINDFMNEKKKVVPSNKPEIIINHNNYKNLEKNEKKLYLKSVKELQEMNTTITKVLNSNMDYFVLVRVKLNKSLSMKKTKYDINENKGKNFKTNNMYLILGFHTLNLEENNRRESINIPNLILNLLNSFNNSGGDYKIDDFVIIGIGANNTQGGRKTLNSNEFYRGLININYELFNLKMVHINTSCGNQMRFIMTLPIYDINGLFMDVYNDLIFETKNYKIDKNNFETWNGNAINKLFI